VRGNIYEPKTCYTSSADNPYIGSVCADAVIAKFDPHGRILWSSAYGGLRNEGGSAIAADAAGNLYAWISTNTEAPGGPGLRGDWILKIEATGPPLIPAALVSSAGFRSPAATGGLASLFTTGLIDTDGIIIAPGFPLPTTLAGISVWFGTSPAPILAVAKVNGQEQVNVLVPKDASGPGTVAKGEEVFAFGGGYAQKWASIFVDPDGRPAITHADFTLVTPANPARPGETIVIFSTGLGAVDPAVSDGEAAPLAPLSRTVTTPQVTIARQSATVLFSGLVPGFAGLYQVNVVVPPIPPGEAALTISSTPLVYDTAVIAVQ
jgi:uncharacterized protein (TIGR03437 family)